MSNHVDQKKNPIGDGQSVRVTISMMDGAQAQARSNADAITGGRDAAHRQMVDSLRNGWQGTDAVAPLSHGDREAAMEASIAAAEATAKRVADARSEHQASQDAHDTMVSRLNDGWKGAA
jgi:uncharacterized protein YukE